MVAKRWNGAGLSAGTAVSAANVNAAGNGDTVAVGQAGTWTAAIASVGGVDVTAAASGVFRLDCTLPTAGLYGQGQETWTPKELPSALYDIGVARSASAQVGLLLLYTDNKIGLRTQANADILASKSPVAVVVNHTYLLDWVWVVGSTTSNGRMFFRVTDQTDPTWNTTGEWFYDTGYATNTGTANTTAVRWVKPGSVALTTGLRAAQVGWDSITVSTATDAATAKTHFIAAPTVTQTGSVPMAGSSTLGVTPAVSHPATVAMSGAGTLGAVGTDQTSGAVAMSGAGSLAIASSVSHPATIGVVGSGSLVVAGSQVAAATVTLSGAGTLAASSQQTITPDQGALVAVESVTTGQAPSVAAGASLTFAHTVNPGVTLLVVAVQASASSGLNTTSTCYYAGLPMTRQGGALSGTGTTAREASIYTLANPPVGTANVQVPARNSGTTYTIAGTAISLTGASGLYGTPATANSASATTITDTTTSPTNSLVITVASVRSTTPITGGAGTSRLNTVYGTNNAFAVNTATGATSLANTYSWTTADAAAIVSLPVSAVAAVPMNGRGDLGAAVAGSQTAAVAIAGTSTLTVTAALAGSGAIPLVGAGALSVTPNLQHAATVAVTGSSSVTIAASNAVVPSAALAGAGTLTIAPAGSASATIAIAGSSALTITSTLAHTSTVTMTGTGNLTVAASLNRPAAATLAGIGTLTVAASRAAVAAVVLAGASGLTVTGTTGPNSDVALAGTGTLGVAAILNRLAALLVAGSGTLAITPSLTRAGTIPLTGSSDLAVTGTLIGNIRSDVALEGVGQLAVAARDEAFALLLLAGTGALDVDAQALPAITSGPSARFVAGPLIVRFDAAGPVLHRPAVTGPLVPRVLIAGPTFHPLTLAGPVVHRLPLTGPEVR